MHSITLFVCFRDLPSDLEEDVQLCTYYQPRKCSAWILAYGNITFNADIRGGIRRQMRVRSSMTAIFAFLVALSSEPSNTWPKLQRYMQPLVDYSLTPKMGDFVSSSYWRVCILILSILHSHNIAQCGATEL